MQKKSPPIPAVPTMAQRALELVALKLPGATLGFRGRELHFQCELSPGDFGRVYRCLFILKPGSAPDVHVLTPNLDVLARGSKIPHTYASKAAGTHLCLWWPKAREWVPQLKLGDTYIPWTAEWLYYFELWLASGEWTGGGQPHRVEPRRWARNGHSRVNR